MATNKTDRACAFPCLGCAGFGTEKVIADTVDIKLLDAVEFVSRDAKGVVKVKALTAGNKLWGVATYAIKATKSGDVMNAGQINIDGINFLDTINPISLTNDENKNLVLKREV